MKLFDIIELGYQKSIHNKTLTLYLTIVMTIAMTCLMLSQIVLSGTYNVLKSGLSNNSLQEDQGKEKYFSFDEYGREYGEPMPKDIQTEIDNKKTQKGVSNVYLVESYTANDSAQIKPKVQMSIQINEWEKNVTTRNAKTTDLIGLEREIIRDFISFKEFAFVDDQLLKPYTFDEYQPETNTIPIYVNSRLPINDSLEKIEKYNQTSNLTDKQKYELTLQPLSTKINQKFDINLSLKSPLDPTQTVFSYAKTNIQKPDQKAKIAGRYSGSAVFINDYVIPMSYKDKVMKIVTQLYPEIKLEQLNTIVAFENEKDMEDYSSRNANFDFGTFTAGFEEGYGPYRIMGNWLSYVIVSVCAVLVAISIYKSILNNSEMVAMLSCLGCNKPKLFLINLATLVLPLALSTLISIFLSQIIKLGLFWIFNQGVFYWFTDSYTNLKFQPDLGIYMSIDTGDYLNLILPIGSVIIAFAITVWITISKISILKTLKS
jgi:hypothetical protein